MGIFKIPISPFGMMDQIRLDTTLRVTAQLTQIPKLGSRARARRRARAAGLLAPKGGHDRSAIILRFGGLSLNKGFRNQSSALEIVLTKVRTRLLKSALRLFSKRGYDAVGVQEIVVSAKVTKPALYHYFGSKRGVIESLFEETVEQLLTALQRLGQPHGDCEAAIESVVETFFAFISSNPAFYRLQLALYFAPVESEGYKAAGKYYIIQRELVVNVLRTALPSQGQRAAEWKATTLIGLINCCAAAYLNEEIALTKDVCKSLARQFLHGAISEG